LALFGKRAMAEKFDPAAPDKHAESGNVSSEGTHGT
jgi:hypothetical protein